jgi:hypothetical protein
MARTSSKGKCHFCGAEFSKAGMSKHLATCPARLAGTVTTSTSRQKTPPTQTRLFHLVVEGRGAPMYWMHLEMPVEATLSNLDTFLRDQWLECCGHLSAFNIAGESYASTVDREWGMDEKSMRGVKLGKVLSVGQQFEHEYDFGTTTELKLKVVAEREGMAVKGKSVQVLAQNEPPEIPCENCGKLATQVCSQCIYEGEGWVCDDCAEEHECGEDMLLPVVNSPRVGMCGYTG